jgi:class 3 adenylate cyclase
VSAPETRYAKSGDVHIAYQVVGEGPLDLVFVPGFVSNVEAAWELPARARSLRCVGRAAHAINREVASLGLSVRAGLHTGEMEMSREKPGGIALHIGARVATQAAGGEVLVSSTVKDRVSGSGIEFDDRGVHALKGVPGEWRLFLAARA